jgi:hypothetical protein
MEWAGDGTHVQIESDRRSERKLRSNAEPRRPARAIRDGQRLVRSQTELASVAVLEESTGEGEDLLRAESDVEGLRSEGAAVEGVEDRLVAGFEREDRTCGGEESGTEEGR